MLLLLILVLEALGGFKQVMARAFVILTMGYEGSASGFLDGFARFSNASGRLCKRIFENYQS